MSQLWLPPQKPPNRYEWKLFHIECYYENDAKVNLPKQIEEQGGEYCGYLPVSSYNVAGQRMDGFLNGHYAVLYRAPEELCLEVLC